MLNIAFLQRRDTFRDSSDLRNPNCKGRYQNDVCLDELENPVYIKSSPLKKAPSTHSIAPMENGVAQEKPPPGSKVKPPEPTKTSKPRVSNWDHQKSSIIGATIFAVISVSALIFLAVFWVRSVRRSWVRRQKEKQDGVMPQRSPSGRQFRSATEKKRRRENLMFSENPSRLYIVEYEGSSVSRVYCAGNSSSANTSADIGHTLQPSQSPSLSIRTEAARHLEDLNSSQRGRSGSLPKQIVIEPPLETVVSRSADTVSPSLEITSPTFEATPEGQESTKGNNEETPGKKDALQPPPEGHDQVQHTESGSNGNNQLSESQGLAEAPPINSQN